jgi:hypothetical protein
MNNNEMVLTLENAGQVIIKLCPDHCTILLAELKELGNICMVLGLKSADNIQGQMIAGHKENSLNPHGVAFLITVPCKDNHLNTQSSSLQA